MFPLFETICIKDGQVLNEKWHQERYEKSYHAFYGVTPVDNIISCVNIPDNIQGVYKLRVNYNKISKEIVFEKYNIQNITSLKVVEDNYIEYGLKYTDRDRLNELCFLKENCDDILVIKNGDVTDCSSSNIVFYNGENWVTPSTPLLKGTARERLISMGIVKEEHIKPCNIKNYSHFKLVNAMREFYLLEKVDIKHIIF